MTIASAYIPEAEFCFLERRQIPLKALLGPPHLPRPLCLGLLWPNDSRLWLLCQLQTWQNESKDELLESLLQLKFPARGTRAKSVHSNRFCSELSYLPPEAYFASSTHRLCL